MKTNLDKLFKTNDDLVQEGVDFVIDDKTSFKVRQFSEQNPRIKAAMAKYYKPHARQIDLQTLPQEKQSEINRNVFVATCLVSWEGVVDENGVAIDFNSENALILFKRLPALFEALWKHANDFQNYKEEYKEDLGNS